MSVVSLLLRPFYTCLCRNICKCPIPIITPQKIRVQSVIGHINIKVPVIVIVPPVHPPPAHILKGNGSRCCTDIDKCPVPVIPPESIESPWTGCKGVEVKITVVIKIPPYPSIGARDGGNSCLTGYVGKGAIPIIFYYNKTVQQDVFISIIVVIAPCNP